MSFEIIIIKVHLPSIYFNNNYRLSLILIPGTSKPVYYRVLLNENFSPNGGTPLSSDVLQRITYHMTFQYGTATKAVRSVPVVYYSSRLANVGMGYINYLRGVHAKSGSLSQLVKKMTIEDEGLVKRKGRDGEEIPHVKYMRNDVSNFRESTSLLLMCIYPLTLNFDAFFLQITLRFPKPAKLNLS